MAILADIASQLEEPFAPEDIEFLPKGAFEKDGKQYCSGFPYADVRVYEDRLNKLACGEWSTPPPTAVVAGNKLITYVTVVICGISHTDVGEAFLTSKGQNGIREEENTGTDAWAQAFKRACSQFGLGRYLYSLDKAYLPYDKLKKKVTLNANGIRDEVRKLYQKAGIAVSGSQRNNVSEQPAQLTTPAARPTQTIKPVEQSSNTQPEKANRAATTSQVDPRVKAAKDRAVDLGLIHTLVDWVALKEQALQRQVKDSDLQPEQIAAIERYIMQPVAAGK